MDELTQAYAMKRIPTASKLDGRADFKSLQVLRAVAAVSVVYYHIGAIPKFGSFGVDIFFVMSGFVMAMVLARGKGAAEFALNRIARIVPLYWLMTTCLLMIAWLAPEILKSTTADLYNFSKSLFFIPYFKEDGSLRPMLAVGWTLNYEMFFYLSIWVSLVFARRLYFQVTIALILLTHLHFGLNSTDRVLSTFFRNTQMLEFVLGMLAFKLYDSSFWPRFTAPVTGGMALLSYALMAVCESMGLHLNGLLIYGLPSMLLLLSMLGLEDAMRESSSSLLSVMTRMGEASYATYLSHFFVVDAIRKFAHQKFDLINPYTPQGVALTVILSLVVGHILYRVADKPLSTWVRSRMRSSRLPVPLAANLG